MSKFTHLHVHTQYSILDGASKTEPLLDRAKELGFDSLAITDHGVMYGVVEFYTQAIKRGIKPIIGCEVYTAPHSMHARVHGVDSDYGHLVLLAEDNIGYKNLMHLVSLSFLEGFYYKPRVDKEILAKYSKGLIALSGCLKGDVSAYLVKDNYLGAKKSAEEFLQIFGKGNFYLEIQDHGIPEQKKVINGMMRLSDELGIELVATNDCHYINREDSFLQDVLTCIQTGKKLNDDDRLKFYGSEFYLKSKSEMQDLFSYAPQAVQNTAKIAERCNVKLDFNTRHLPEIKLDTELSHFEYLKKLCFDGAKQKYDVVDNVVADRLNYELDVIQKMGFTDYFLIVWDFIKFAKDAKIPIGPGRGSAAGSIVSYTLNITEIDPLKYDLLFERFLNPERISMPDIDIDISDERRDEVKAYVASKYGETKVAGIATFGTMAARAAVRDVGRVMDINPGFVDKVAKAVPQILGIKLNDAISSEGELKTLYQTNGEAKKLLDTAMKLEGFVRNVSTHAAGVVIADEELFNYVPVQNGDNLMLTQYTMESLEKIGLLKMDFLGLRNLTIIDNTVKLVKQNQNKNIDISKLDYSDKKTFELISNGDTEGVFQLENPGLKSFLRKFKPSKLEHIIASTSLYRPGPMEQIPMFLQNVNNPDSISYLHPSLEPILKPTYGAIVYQEQVMQIVRTLAGYSMSRADLVRRAMSKKKNEQMQKEREVFINGLCDENGKVIVPGTRRNGIDDETANRIFDLLTEFANYAFNKSHAACYATLAYQTAYLKANYPTEYLTALLVSLCGNSHKTNTYVNDFKRFGIKLLRPDINKSYANFSVEGTNVRFGLSAIRNAGINFPQSIVSEREKNGEFADFDDFARRMSKYDGNKRCVESLIKAGAFDSIRSNRGDLLYTFEDILSVYKDNFSGKSSDQLDMFAELDNQIPPKHLSYALQDLSDEEKLAMEKEYTGMYFSGDPMQKYSPVTAMYADDRIYSVYDDATDDGTTLKLCGIVSNVSVSTTKNGVFICTMNFSDSTDTAELTAFEKTFVSFKNLLTEGAVLCINATVRKRNDKTSLNLISAIDANAIEIPSNAILYLRLADKMRLEEVKSKIRKYHGNNKVCIYIEETNTVLKSDSRHGVKISPDCVTELCEMLNFENVKIK